MNVEAAAGFEVRVEVLADEEVLLVSVFGPVGLEDLRTLPLAALRHPAYAPGWGVIYDFTEADAERISSEELRIVVDDIRRAEQRRRHRVAHVVPHDLSFGLARIYDALARMAEESDGRLRHVTREREAALDWMRETRPS